MTRGGARGPIRSHNNWLTIDGETKTLTQWSEEYGVSKQLIRARLAAGMDPELAVVTPPRKYGRKTDARNDSR